MKIIKIVLIGLAAIIALVLLIAAFVKKDFNVERSITINKPRQEVFNYIKELKNQENYSVWNKRDPGMKKEYKGTDGTVGFVSSWDSSNKDVGTGEQEITKLTEGERVDSRLHFVKPFESVAQAYMTTEAETENQTKVKWGFDSSMPYPMNITLLFMDMDKVVGKDFEDGLKNLRDVLEK